MLDVINTNIETSGNRTRYAMYYFVVNVGVSYLPLHKKALELANRIGFKRKYVRC